MKEREETADTTVCVLPFEETKVDIWQDVLHWLDSRACSRNIFPASDTLPTVWPQVCKTVDRGHRCKTSRLNPKLNSDLTQLWWEVRINSNFTCRTSWERIEMCRTAAAAHERKMLAFRKKQYVDKGQYTDLMIDSEWNNHAENFKF